MKPKSQSKRIFFLAKPFWPRILGISLLIILLSAINQVYPLINKALVDLISTGQTSLFLIKRPTFVNLIILFLSFKLTATLINRLSIYGGSMLSSSLRHHLREIGFKHLLTLSVGFYNKHQSGNVMSKISRGTDGIRSIINSIGLHLLPSLVTGFISVLVVISFNWKIGLSAALMFVPFFYLRLLRFKANEKIEKRQNRIWDREYGHFWEVISNIRLVKTFTAENYEIGKLRRIITRLHHNNHLTEQTNNKGVVADLLVDVWTVALYGYIFYLGLSGSFTLGTVVLLVQYVEMIKQPLWNLSWIFWEVKYAQVGIRDYLKILDTKPDTVEIENPIHLTAPIGLVEFDNVWFKYKEKSGQDVFHSLSFNVSPGKTLALVGRSGVGKTTVAHLMVRFFDPDKGQIKIDNLDIRDLSFTSLRGSIGLVMQESYLFDDTIANNLRYGKPDATNEEMMVACQVANALEFINKLPKKLDTVIGERGVKLSGGQKQRLSIARTILKNPRILILDEATSSLDSHSEMLVQDALWKLIQGRTTIIIAHRLSTVQKADQILVLNKKKIAEQGTHQELLAKDGIYASLHHIQSGHLEKLKEWDLVS
ncbi:ABC transporter ATP-binding protein [Candidatus Collierbacteria bacterium]|nr:ABC transporter ATP-binding protein [Candidatus Collierbacteria bacterium]